MILPVSVFSLPAKTTNGTSGVLISRVTKKNTASFARVYVPNMSSEKNLAITRGASRPRPLRKPNSSRVLLSFNSFFMSFSIDLRQINYAGGCQIGNLRASSLAAF